MIAATNALGPSNVLVVASGHAPAWATASGAQVIVRPGETLDQPDELIDVLLDWFEKHASVTPTRGVEAQTLLDQRQWRAALIAAVTELELALQKAPLGREVNDRVTINRPMSLKRTLNDPSLRIDDRLRERLIGSVSLRNAALHQGANVTAAQARRAVTDVSALPRSLGHG